MGNLEDMSNHDEPLTSIEIGDWLDTILDHTWTRRFDIGWNNQETAFYMGGTRNPQVRIQTNDGTLEIVEYDGNGVIEAETRMSGDMRRQLPRVLAILGIDA